MNIHYPEEILLDENIEATKHAFYAVKGLTVSNDEKMLAYGEDTQGYELYTLRIKVII